MHSNTMNFFTVSLFLVLGIVLTTTSTAQGQEDQSICVCPYIYSPVCGSNGQTYGNKCALECDAKDGVTLLYNGVCNVEQKIMGQPLCPCPKIYRPVCGSNGKTYVNRCLFKCAQGLEPGITIAKKEAC